MRRGLTHFLKSNIKLQLSLLFILLWIFTALLAPYIASEDGGIIPYQSTSIDFQNANSVGPFDEQNLENNKARHWLGTDELGRDVLANLIHGSRTALLVGFGAVALAALIGILLGSLAAYFGDDQLKVFRLELLLFLLYFLLILLAFYLFPWAFASSSAILLFLAVIIGSIFLFRFLQKGIRKKSKQQQKRKISFPLDLLIGRSIETMDALPLLFILVVLAAVFEPSIFSTLLIIGLVGWATVAKYTRAEVLKVKQMDYIESGKALGISNVKLILKHLLPNALPVVLVTLAFGISSAILIESTLSFLGLGISSETASWGKLLSEARSDYKAWWLTIFPGLAIFCSIVSCNIIGEELGKINR